MLCVEIPISFPLPKIFLASETGRSSWPRWTPSASDIAMLSEADGVHLGQDDLPVSEARKILGRGKLIGISTHNIEQALKAEREGADYIGFGPIFETETKADAEE